MAYVTSANFSRLVRSFELNKFNFDGEIYEQYQDFFEANFNKLDKNIILATKMFFEHPEEFLNEVYVKQKKAEDTHTFVYESRLPAYHKSPTCEKIVSKYRNYEIPLQIRSRGEQEVINFRKWFRGQESEIFRNPRDFLDRQAATWHVSYTQADLNLLTGWAGRGVKEIDNFNLQKYREEIGNLIDRANRYKHSNSKIEKILTKYAKYAYKYKSIEPMEGNDTGCSDVEVKQVLKKFEFECKKKLQDYLLNYHRLKLNPDVELRGDLLSQLGFEPCAKCYEQVKGERFVLPSER